MNDDDLSLIEIVLIGLVIIIINLAISYGLALLDEPRSLWLWKDILGVIK